MLRISYSHTEAGQQWTLYGQLTGLWVQELMAFWRYTRKAAPIPRAIVNLSDVTFIDENGEELLSEMRRAGVEFITSGVANRDLLDNLQSQGCRPVRRRMEY